MDFNENKPIYLQIADRIMDDIQQRILPPEGRLPSVRDYAAEMQVNPNTMMRTYTWLQDRELISMKRGIGYFVTPSAPQLIENMRRRQFFDRDAIMLMTRLKQFNVSPDELKNLYENFLKSEK